MIFEFIIVHQPHEDAPILGILCECLRNVMEANLNDVEADALTRMVRINFQRPLPANADGGEPRAVLGFSLELAEETASIREVVDGLPTPSSQTLSSTPLNLKTRCYALNWPHGRRSFLPSK